MSLAKRSAAVCRGWRVFVVALVLAFGLAPVASAMRVAPMVAELSTSGAGSVARIEVGNVGSAAMPFETAITRLEMDANGVFSEIPADEDFLVFPPQGVVAVSGQQVVRVQWVGPPITQSRAYYLAVKQIPVRTDPMAIPDTQSAISVNVLYTMKTLLVVAPPGARPEVQVRAAAPAPITPPTPEFDPSLPMVEQPPQASVPGIRVEVVNTGTRYALMSGATWTVDGTDMSGQPFSRRLTGTEVSQLVGVGYVPPGGGQRVFNLPLGVELDPAKPVSVRFTK
ncbi:MAG: molecular chaperone [Brevundimonas sp.]|nr:MAG: molecular chaperone [Brevundimonas sp.]